MLSRWFGKGQRGNSADTSGQTAQPLPHSSQQAGNTAPSSSPAVLAVRATGQTRLSQRLLPGSDIGPETVDTPVTGYSVTAEVACVDGGELRVLGLTAEVTARIPRKFDGVVMHTSEDSKPLELPQFEILLDADPPLIRPALGADGQPVRPTPELPQTLHVGEQAKFLLAPVTHDESQVAWALYLDWEYQGQRNKTRFGYFGVTGTTGFRTFRSGRPPEESPVTEVAPEHWDTRYKEGA